MGDARQGAAFTEPDSRASSLRMETTYDFDRFVSAQDAVYHDVLDQLKNGRKTGDWMACIFPQLEGLEYSDVSGFYTIRDRDEAAAYLAHPVLGSRLIECAKLAIHQATGGAQNLFDHVEEQQFHACISLFSRAKGASAVFESALFAFYGGTADPRTLKALHLVFVATLED